MEELGLLCVLRNEMTMSPLHITLCNKSLFGILLAFIRVVWHLVSGYPVYKSPNDLLILFFIIITKSKTFELPNYCSKTKLQ